MDRKSQVQSGRFKNRPFKEPSTFTPFDHPLWTKLHDINNYRDVFLDDAFVSSDSLTNGVLLHDEKSISSTYS